MGTKIKIYIENHKNINNQILQKYKKILKILKEILKKVWIRWKLIKTHNNIGKILRNDQISNNMHIEVDLSKKIIYGR